MEIQKIAAFSKGDEGGNPAGVVLLDKPIDEKEMARVAAEVGFSETVYAVSQDETGRKWRARYFSPETEVPFCGHATIALGAVLGQRSGAGVFELALNDGVISVDAQPSE
ncbi:PhzF family phenazine biosynthesis protein, partial [Escherichia coli]|nr:PhzF family phenazine biosynthesis protein [Escherichia coli]